MMWPNLSMPAYVTILVALLAIIFVGNYLQRISITQARKSDQQGRHPVDKPKESAIMRILMDEDWKDFIMTASAFVGVFLFPILFVFLLVLLGNWAK